MRGLRSTIALLVVLIGLGAYIYFVTWKKPAEPASKQEKVFAGIDSSKLEELKVASDKGDVTTLKKEGGNWQLVAPLAAKADESEVSGIANALGQLEIVRVIDENPTNLNDYGLMTPRIEIDFKVTGDKDFRKLSIGEKSPTGSDLFARRNDDKKVFLIPSYQETTLNRSTFELRDKVVLKFERDKVEGVEVKAGDKTLQVAKDNTEWKMTQPATGVEGPPAAGGPARRGAARTATVGGYEVDRHRDRESGRLEKVRSRQTFGDCRCEDGQRTGNVARRLKGREQHGVCTRHLEGLRGDNRQRTSRRVEEDAGRL